MKKKTTWESSSGMLIGGEFLSEEDARYALRKLFETVQRQDSSYCQDFLKAIQDFRLRFAEVGDAIILKKETCSTNTLKQLYQEWEQLAKRWLGIPETGAMLVQVNREGKTIDHIYYSNLETNFLSNQSSAIDLKLNAYASDEAKNSDFFQNLMMKNVENSLKKHYSDMVSTCEDPKYIPTIQELDFALEHVSNKKALRRLHAAKTENLTHNLEQWNFRRQVFGNSDEGVRYGRYSELFSSHLMRHHYDILKGQIKLRRKTVKAEEGDGLLALAINTMDTASFTTGGDLIVAITLEGKTQLYSIQLKTSSTHTGGAPVRSSVIWNTSEKWISILSNLIKTKDIDTAIDKMYNEQATQGFIARGRRNITRLGEETIDKIVENLLKQVS